LITKQIRYGRSLAMLSTANDKNFDFTEKTFDII